MPQSAAGRRRAWVVTAAALAVLMVLWATLLLGDDEFTWLIREEHPIELAGALALLACSVLCVLVFRRARWPALARASLLGLALLFFFGAGEEVSWGQRVFGIETPAELAERNVQGEITLHNLETFDEGILSIDRLFQLFWAAMGVGIPLLALWPRARAVLVRLVPVLPAPLAIAFVANQLLAWGWSALVDAREGLYNSTVFPVDHSIFEIKETGVALLLAAGLWVVHREVRDQRAAAVG